MLVFPTIVFATEESSTTVTTTKLITTKEMLEAEKKYEVKLVNCMNASSSWIEINGEKKVISLLAYDSKDTSINSKINEYACKILNNAKKIEIEYDSNAPRVDKYNRELVWVYVDDLLLQEELIKMGYGEVNNITNKYSHVTDLCTYEAESIKNSLGIWELGEEEDYCNSGIDITITKKVKNIEKVKSNETDSSTLGFTIFSFSIIIILVLCIVVGKIYEKKR